MTVYLFNTWSEASILCRELNRPIVAKADKDGLEESDAPFARLFPSGRFEPLKNKTGYGPTDIIKDKRGHRYDLKKIMQKIGSKGGKAKGSGL